VGVEVARGLWWEMSYFITVAVAAEGMVVAYQQGSSSRHDSGMWGELLNSSGE
jgi:hypothetical protein